MRALILPVAALTLSLISIAPAQAQSFDGTYRGTRQFERVVEHPRRGGQGDTCARTSPVVFHVKDSVITVFNFRAGVNVSAPVAGDGTFKLTSGYTGGGGGGRGVKWEMIGKITGTQLTATQVGNGVHRTCYYSLAARRQGRG